MAVTKEQIFSAADELAAAGQRPTLEAIRQITGGSYTTISPALNEWKARQATAAAPLREPAPQAVADRLAELGTDIWTIALDMANNRLAVEREGLEKARAELEADRNEATELADKLAGDVEALQSRLASIQAAEAAARGEADELRGQLAKVQARAEADQEAHQEQRKQAAAEAHRMAERLTAAQAEREQAMKAAAQAREDAARLAGQLDTLKEQSAALLARITPPTTEAKPATKKKPAAE